MRIFQAHLAAGGIVEAPGACPGITMNAAFRFANGNDPVVKLNECGTDALPSLHSLQNNPTQFRVIYGLNSAMGQSA